MLFLESTAEEYGWQQTDYITHLEFTHKKNKIRMPHLKSYLGMALTFKDTVNKSHWSVYQASIYVSLLL